jgi:hypothetical protein
MCRGGLELRDSCPWDLFRDMDVKEGLGVCPEHKSGQAQAVVLTTSQLNSVTQLKIVRQIRPPPPKARADATSQDYYQLR